MEKLVEKMLEKQDEMNNEIRDIRVLQAEHNIQLAEHMRRSLLNEEAVGILKDELKPIQRHVNQVDGVLKFFGGLSIAVGVVAGIIKIIEFI